jgi:hypothetical protein
LPQFVAEPRRHGGNWYEGTLTRRGNRTDRTMAKKGTTEKVKKKAARAAKSGVDTLRDIAGQAIRAAAVAAAGVALTRTAQALRGGAKSAEAAAPSPQSLPRPVARPAKRAKTRAKARRATVRPAKKKAGRRRSSR